MTSTERRKEFDEVHIQVAVPRTMRKKFKKHCENTGHTMSDWIRLWIDQALKDHQQC